MRSFGLLTDKALVVVVNAPQGEGVPGRRGEVGPEALAIDAQLELELQQMSPDERAGSWRSGASRSWAATGSSAPPTTPSASSPSSPPATRRSAAGTWRRAASAVDAAGKIHTDLARGFIRAEVTAFDDLKRAGSEKEAKAQNLQRLEGKDYIVQDGDVMYFRSSI